MTKLMEWILGLSIFTSVWLSLVTGRVRLEFADQWQNVIIPLPIILILLFGAYAATVVLWRVYNLNDCEDAAKELQQQIEEARSDLRKKGLIFENKT